MSELTDAMIAKLLSYAKHARNCNAMASFHSCGASNGRRGKCPNRAVHSYQILQRHPTHDCHATIHRCADHPHGSEPTVLAVFACSCGLESIRAAVETARVDLARPPQDPVSLLIRLSEQAYVAGHLGATEDSETPLEARRAEAEINSYTYAGVRRIALGALGERIRAATPTSVTA